MKTSPWRTSPAIAFALGVVVGLASSAFLLVQYSQEQSRLEHENATLRERIARPEPPVAREQRAGG